MDAAAAMEGEPAGVTERQRLDKWLFFARLAKSRGAAQKMVGAGHVRLNREKIRDSAKALKAGDVLTLSGHGPIRVLRVLAMAERRGPYSEARLLYEDLNATTAETPGEETQFPEAPPA